MMMADPKVPINAHGELGCEQCMVKTMACHSFCKDSLANLQKGITKDANSVSSGAEEDVLECIKLQSTLDPENSIGRRPKIEGDKPHEQQSENIDQWQKKTAETKENSFIFISKESNVHDLLQQDGYYCSDCNTVACLECVTGMHASHKCDKMSTILIETLSHLRNSVQPACRCVSQADTLLQQLVQDNESIEFNRKLCKESIAKVFDEIRTTLDKREELILTTLDSYTNCKLYQMEQQKINIEEVQDQLHKCVQEIQKDLKNTIVDVDVLIDKQQIMDVQEQRIHDIEDGLQTSKFSSTYIGFCDNSHTFQAKLDEVFVMCEYYPDADSGYYTSRKISLQTKENLYTEVKFQCMPECTPDFSEIMSSISCHPNNFVEERCDNFDHELGLTPLKRSLSTPSSTTRPLEFHIRKRRSECVTNRSNGPMIPIRFDSLQTPTLIKTPLSVFDKLSTSKTEVVHPCGVCVGENNSIIITDVKYHCLRIISSNGRCIGDIGREGKRSELFEDPCAVVVNEKAQIFVCQRENPRILKLTSAGKCMKKLGHKSLGEPWAMAVAQDGKLYVTDWDRSCIHIFHRNGDYHSAIGGDDSLLGESLRFPAGIAMNADGQLIVADRGNHCLWLLETNGKILKRIGSKGHQEGELYYPYGVAVHQNGLIIVSESGNNRISVFSPCGKYLNHFGQRGSEPGMFEHPRHVCVTPKGEVIVADELNHRLQLFDI